MSQERAHFMAGNPRRSRKQSDPISLLLHYANAKATEQTWRGIVLGPGDSSADSDAAVTPFGVESLSKFNAVQTELTEILDRVIALESAFAVNARELAWQITDLAQPKFTGWAFSTISDKLFELWDTENSSFRELVFFTLAQTLKTVRFRDLHRCEACGKFFVGSSKRDRKFCSNACRSRVTVRRHREKLARTPALRTTKGSGSPHSTEESKRRPRR